MSRPKKPSDSDTADLFQRESAKKESRRVSPYRSPPGYQECKRRIDVLRRFQDLVRHRERWADQIEFARPLAELLPEGTTEVQRPAVIEQQIARLVPEVHYYLNQADIRTQITHQLPIFDKETNDVVMKSVGQYDVVGDYFSQPEDRRGRTRQQWFTALMHMLEGGIAVYEFRRDRAYRERFNPLIWIAALLRAPMFVVERAGIVRTDEERSAVLQFYGWFLRIIVAVILILFATKLGISIPWHEVFSALG